MKKNKYKMECADAFRKVIDCAGGKVEGSIVKKPGVLRLSETRSTISGEDFYYDMCIGSDIDESMEYAERAEFNARITYMNFTKEVRGDSEYVRKITQEYGHYSVHASTHVQYLFAGVSLECSLELIAHREATVARLTSSRTNAMVDGLYVDSPGFNDYLTCLEVPPPKHLGSNSFDSYEVRNRLRPGAKATALTVSMSLKDWHKTFIGRMSNNGVERELRDVLEVVCADLNKDYPLAILTPDAYLKLGNEAKYKE